MGTFFVAVLLAVAFSIPAVAQEVVFLNGLEQGDYPWSSCSGCPLPGGCFVIDRGEPWAGTIDPALVSTTPYSNDAFLVAVESAAAALPLFGSESVSLWVEQTTVASVGYEPATGMIANFWVADAFAAMRVYLSSGVRVQPGDRISFTATEVSNYGGELEITALSDLTVNSVENPVYVPESNAVPLSYAIEGREVHRIFGEVTANLGSCGPTNTCFDLTHERPLSSFVSHVRTSLPLSVGDCVEIVGPVNTDVMGTLFNIWNVESIRIYGSIP